MADGVKATWRNHIGGQWVDGSAGRIAIEDPASGDQLAECALGGIDDIDRAVAAARACHEAGALAGMRPGERGRMVQDMGRWLEAHGDEIARVLCLDSGKCISQARMELDGAARYFDYYGGYADKLEGKYIPLGRGYADYVVPVPYGVSGQIIPWNYPLEMAARSASAALAAGNACVIKSPEIDPLAVTYIASAAEAVGLPDGAVNVVCGLGQEAGAALASHAGVDQIVFTGSVPTGIAVMQAAAGNVVPTVMELGGKSAGIVMADADLDDVTESTKWGIYLNSGQVCSAMSRLIVHRSVHDEVVERIAAMTGDLTMGPGIEDHFITPLVSAAQLDRVEGFALSGAQAGARAVTGGRRADRPGHFMQATIFDGVSPDMAIAREEIFGPVLSVLSFEDDEEAIAIANGTDYGLVAGVFTADLERAHTAAARLEAGQIFVNEWYAGGTETPFGGFKRSGFGREKGVEAIWNYVQSKNVAIRLKKMGS